MNRRPLRFVAIAYAALVLWATIGPTPWRTTSGSQLEGGILNPDSWTAPVTWTTGYLSEMAFNVAIFIPVAFLTGNVGRLFNEFGMTVAVAVLISGFVALSLTPMLSSRMLRGHQTEGRLARAVQRLPALKPGPSPSKP